MRLVTSRFKLEMVLRSVVSSELHGNPMHLTMHSQELETTGFLMGTSSLGNCLILESVRKMLMPQPGLPIICSESSVSKWTLMLSAADKYPKVEQEILFVS